MKEGKTKTNIKSKRIRIGRNKKHTNRNNKQEILGKPDWQLLEKPKRRAKPRIPQRTDRRSRKRHSQRASVLLQRREDDSRDQRNPQSARRAHKHSREEREGRNLPQNTKK